MKKLLITAIALSFVAGYIVAAHATNGMNIEGFGPIALSMGGASFAYDNGSAAMMNNPATIGLSQKHRFDIALGFLGPDVKAIAPGGVATADSDGDAYYMPAIGWTSNKGQLSYGIGVFGQGGMGTEYANNTWVAGLSQEENRSEVSVGRAMIPLAYNVNDKFTVGGSLDFVWAGMDIKMDMPGGDLVSMMMGTSDIGYAKGDLINTIGGYIQAGFIDANNPVNWGRFEFSNGNDFTGEARGYGVAGKIGLVYKVTPQFSVGATYHSKTALGDLETDNAKVVMNVNAWNGVNGFEATPVELAGKISVKDFEWPATYGIGMAYQVTDRFMVAADIKQICWSDVMENFKMTFTADKNDPTAQYFGVAGQAMDVALYQDWDDQTVVALGAAFKATDMVTLRAGYNHASNPIPDKYINYLFPAIIEDHITAGLGLDFNEASSLNFAMSFALKTDQTNSLNQIKSEHSQLSWQLMYSYKY